MLKDKWKKIISNLLLASIIVVITIKIGDYIRVLYIEDYNRIIDYIKEERIYLLKLEKEIEDINLFTEITTVFTV